MIRRTQAEEILGEWGIRDGSVDAVRVRDELHESLVGSPLQGRPLRRRLRNFTPDPAGYVASMGGPLPYMQRLRTIEELTDLHLLRLDDRWRSLARECGRDRDAFARRWRATIARWSFAEVNDLIDRHNRYYPAEARLPMDPRTGDFVSVGGGGYRRRPLDETWALERFPAVLPRALAA
jgi:hypothetical protein